MYSICVAVWSCYIQRKHEGLRWACHGILWPAAEAGGGAEDGELEPETGAAGQQHPSEQTRNWSIEHEGKTWLNLAHKLLSRLSLLCGGQRGPIELLSQEALVQDAVLALWHKWCSCSGCSLSFLCRRCRTVFFCLHHVARLLTSLLLLVSPLLLMRPTSFINSPSNHYL